jgi:hypothetical protein
MNTNRIAKQEFGSFKDVHAIRTKRRNGRLTAGPIYCPIYVVNGTQGEHPDKVLIDDEAYTADDDREAAKIAILRRVDTELSDLIWTRKIGVVTIKGIASRKGKVGIFDVLFFAGPTFDNGRRADDRAVAQRRAAGLPTGTPGDRRIIVPVPIIGTPGHRRLD